MTQSLLGIHKALVPVDRFSDRRVRRASRRLYSLALRDSELKGFDAITRDLETSTLEAMILAHRAGTKAARRVLAELRSWRADNVSRILTRATDFEKSALRELYGSIARGATNDSMSKVRDALLKNLFDVATGKREKKIKLKMSAGSPHAQTAMRTQTSIAFNAAAWVETNEDEELWGYELATSGDERVRPEHEDMDGVRYPKDHDFWKRYAPPNGYNCRCALNPILVGSKDAKIKPMKGTPQVDPAFQFNPGRLVERVLL